MIDSANTEALLLGASVYYGRPLLNSINAEDEKLHEMIPVLKKSGGAVVAMVTGVDVPVLAEERLKNAQKITRLLFDVHGFEESDLVFDCLGLVVSAMQDGSRATLKTIALIKEYFPGSATTLGLSNVSFGLPNRNFVHTAFLASAVQHGLDSAIMSVTDPMSVIIAGAAEMWGVKPKSVESFINRFSEKVELSTSAGAGNSAERSPKDRSSKRSADPAFVAQLPELERKIFFGIVEGEKDNVVTLIKEFIAKSPDGAMDLFSNVMTPAIRRLGDLFAERVKFIPHLMAAAEAMKMGVAVLEPYLIKARAADGEKGVIIFATVKGDIHDIGKNICVLMLRNFGFEVIDLGRNVDPELILSTAIEKKAQVIALSALMTTTMIQMKVVIDAVRSRNLPFKVIIGGAVVTSEFATEIHADGYSTDVGTVVSEIEKVIAIFKALDLK
jgi:5-methyltetrahydrofolate--homocysteine methyltransferase